MTERRILYIEVSSAEAALDEFARTWERAERGEALQAIETVGFESIPQMLSTLTPGRWDLIQALKRQGPATIDFLAASVGRDPARVRQDVDALVDLGIMESGDGRYVSVPWDEIDLRVPLAA